MAPSMRKQMWRHAVVYVFPGLFLGTVVAEFQHFDRVFGRMVLMCGAVLCFILTYKEKS